MTFNEIAKLVNRKEQTVKKAFNKLPISHINNFYYMGKEKYIISDTCDELCRKFFKQSYLEYLEELYLQLKNKLIEKGVEINYEL